MRATVALIPALLERILAADSDIGASPSCRIPGQKSQRTASVVLSLFPSLCLNVPFSHHLPLSATVSTSFSLYICLSDPPSLSLSLSLSPSLSYPLKRLGLS